jgi:hypothetical protein
LSSAKFCALRAPTWTTSRSSTAAGASSSETTSETILSPRRSAASRKRRSATNPSPWNDHGNVRGFHAPRARPHEAGSSEQRERFLEVLVDRTRAGDQREAACGKCAGLGRHGPQARAFRRADAPQHRQPERLVARGDLVLSPRVVRSGLLGADQLRCDRVALRDERLDVEVEPVDRAPQITRGRGSIVHRRRVLLRAG